mmetsp:Transcript_21139/g.46596  ORF Transcript_21139/g.46596 Transcript_21139/m.46596 type:complete len:430 (-) Transcript_21139:91-1380(-)
MTGSKAFAAVVGARIQYSHVAHHVHSELHRAALKSQGAAGRSASAPSIEAHGAWPGDCDVACAQTASPCRSPSSPKRRRPQPVESAQGLPSLGHALSSSSLPSLSAASSVNDHPVGVEEHTRLPIKAVSQPLPHSTSLHSTGSPSSPSATSREQREAIRLHLTVAAGDANRAFARLDSNGSGRIPFQDFADGLSRLGVPWQEIIGSNRPREIFRLFDRKRDGVIDFAELFPNESREAGEPRRLDTPEFLNYWCRRTSEPRMRAPKWRPSGPEEALPLLMNAVKRGEEAAEGRKHLSACFWRLKGKGKSDGRCRECLAKHLPRGSGPPDRDGIPSITEAEVIACRRSYTDAVLEPVKHIQRVVHDLRDQRRELQGCRQHFLSSTIGSPDRLTSWANLAAQEQSQHSQMLDNMQSAFRAARASILSPHADQ